MMVTFIDQHRMTYGVEPICRVLPIAPSTYFRYKAQQRDPSQRSVRDKTPNMKVTYYLEILSSWCYWSEPDC